MRILSRPLSLACLMGAMIAGPHAAAADDVVAQADWPYLGVSWSSGSTTHYRFDVFNSDGKVMLCGAIATRGRGTAAQQFTRALKNDLVLRINDEQVERNLSFFRTVGSRYLADQLIGAAANCEVLDVDFPSGEFSYWVGPPNSSGSYRVDR
ncbi:hypothetical protein [Aestuariibius sp. HNIBRBA575]|uniref:hypothetical protein n=1 Tax=Aestuariibius sp. HNIBRBA575 TaxID=3233343 RepID=UPI0034A463AB